MNETILTFDMDWATDQQIEYVLDKLDKYNLKSTWFVTHDTKTLDRMRKDKFTIESIEPFGIYFFISRVIHPLLVKPNTPKYNAKINKIAADLESKLDNKSLDIGHQRLYVLKKERK